MPSETVQAVGLVLLGLGFVLVTCVLYVLASQRYYAIETHERVRQSKALRRQYLEAVRRKGPGRKDY